MKTCDSVREHQPGVSYLLRFHSGASTRSLVSPVIPFGSINPESRIFLRFRSRVSTRSLVSSCDSTRSLVSFYDSVREHQPGVSYPLTIPFGIINPKSRIFLRFHSGASTRSLVFSYDSVRKYQPGVSYFPTIPFGSINPESCIIFLTIPFEKCDSL